MFLDRAAFTFLKDTKQVRYLVRYGLDVRLSLISKYIETFQEARINPDNLFCEVGQYLQLQWYQNLYCYLKINKIQLCDTS